MINLHIALFVAWLLVPVVLCVGLILWQRAFMRRLALTKPVAINSHQALYFDENGDVVAKYVDGQWIAQRHIKKDELIQMVGMPDRYHWGFDYEKAIEDTDG